MTQKGTLREVMPETAALVDELRQALGKELADRIVLGGKAGKGTFRAVEIGPDGQARTFGSFHKSAKWPGDSGTVDLAAVGAPMRFRPKEGR